MPLLSPLPGAGNVYQRRGYVAGASARGLGLRQATKRSDGSAGTVVSYFCAGYPHAEWALMKSQQSLPKRGPMVLLGLVGQVDVRVGDTVLVAFHQ